MRNSSSCSFQRMTPSRHRCRSQLALDSLCSLVSSLPCVCRRTNLEASWRLNYCWFHSSPSSISSPSQICLSLAQLSSPFFFGSSPQFPVHEHAYQRAPWLWPTHKPSRALLAQLKTRCSAMSDRSDLLVQVALVSSSSWLELTCRQIEACSPSCLLPGNHLGKSIHRIHRLHLRLQQLVGNAF